MQTTSASSAALTTDTITQLSTSIFEASSNSLVNDTYAYTTVDIIKTALKNINSWCPRSPPTYSSPSSTQTTSTFTVDYQTGDYVLPITAFTATASCGTAIWKYSAVNPTNSNPFVYSTDMLGTDLNTGAIKVNTIKAVGTYEILVIGTLPDLTTTRYEIFTIKILPNQLPQFSSALSAQSVALMGTITVTPSMSDPDTGDTVTISAVYY